MRPNLVADGMPLRSRSKLLARVQHDAYSLPVEMLENTPLSNLGEFAEEGRSRAIATGRLDFGCSSSS